MTNLTKSLNTIVIPKLQHKMPMRARENLIGAWAFFIGIILAIIVGIVAGSRTNHWILAILIVLGIIIGYFVSEKDVQTFLFASVSLVIVSWAALNSLVLNQAIVGIDVGQIFSTILGALIMLFTPATIMVALKTVFSIAKS
jgi:hypothetical protein